jgi:hypothetical protein
MKGAIELSSIKNHISDNPKKIKSVKVKKVDAAKTMNKKAPIEITFRVYKDEDGVLCATGIDQRLYTFGKTYNKLIKNINDIVELFFGLPHTQVTINLKFEAQGNSSTETATC